MPDIVDEKSHDSNVNKGPASASSGVDSSNHVFDPTRWNHDDGEKTNDGGHLHKAEEPRQVLQVDKKTMKKNKSSPSRVLHLHTLATRGCQSFGNAIDLAGK